MKKWNLMLSMFLMAGALFVTSCSDDEETDPGPSLTLKGGAEYTSTDATIQVEEAILVGVTGASSTVSNEKLTRFKFSIVSNNVPETFVDSSFSAATFNWETEITFSSVGEANLLFELWDKGGKKVEKSFTITVENGAVAVKKALAVEFGSFNDVIGSFYNTTDMSLYTVAQAKANQAKVDFFFYMGAQNGNTIAAPDDVLAATEISTFQLNTWTTRNATRFVKGVVTAAQFDAITTTFDFPPFSSTSSFASQLVDGDVVFFQTASGKLGLIKVVDLYFRGDRAKLDIIVQE